MKQLLKHSNVLSVFLRNSVSTCSFTSSPPACPPPFSKAYFPQPFFLLLYGRTHFKDWHRVQPGELFFFYILIPYFIFALLPCFCGVYSLQLYQKRKHERVFKILDDPFLKMPWFILIFELQFVYYEIIRLRSIFP